MRQRTRRIEEIETEVNKLEAAQAKNEELLCDPEIYQNHEEVSRLNGENEKISSQLSTLMEEWEELQLLLEE
jgi:ATP-binding cassette, subfamily F, member 3